MSEARETRGRERMDLTAWPSPLFSLGSSLPCPLRSIDSRVTEERGEEQTRKREEVSDGGTGWVSDQVTRKDGCGTKGRNRKGMVWERSDPSPSLTIPSSHPSLLSVLDCQDTFDREDLTVPFTHSSSFFYPKPRN